MNTTSATLLERLRQPREQDAWGRFVHLYSPLLYYWASRLGIPEPDAADLVQDVFTTLVQKLPDFCYDPGKGFRNWLRTVLVNRWRDQCRRRNRVTPGGDWAALENVAAPEGDWAGEVEYRHYLVSQALRLMQDEFAPRTWKACWEHVVLGRSAADVASELGISVGSVYVAKSRVLSRLRQELQGLLD